MLLRMRPAERRVLMAAGMGAGIAAIFRAPLAGALFAAEVLYCSPGVRAGSHHARPGWPASSLLHVRRLLRATPWNRRSFAPGPRLRPTRWQLGPYLLLAVCVVVLAMHLHPQLLRLHAPVPPPADAAEVKPAVGAFLTGARRAGLYYGPAGSAGAVRAVVRLRHPAGALIRRAEQWGPA